MFRSPMLGLLLAALTAAAHAETYYVATDGKPENDGSRDKPWPAVDFALKKVGGGHTIVVRPGFYRGPLEVARAFAGTERSPTVVRSEEKWKAIVVGSPGNGVTVGDDCDRVTIEGFEVLGAWYRDWAYGYLPKTNSTPMIDLWEKPQIATLVRLQRNRTKRRLLHDAT